MRAGEREGVGGRLGGEHLHNLMNGTILSEKKKTFLPMLCFIHYLNGINIFLCVYIFSVCPVLSNKI